jgi:ribosome-associated heat shock protein Hsp15
MPPASRAKKKTRVESFVERQRIDRWLWHARIVKTRMLAASLVTSGHVRVNGRRVEASGHAVRKADVLTVALPSTVRILRVVDYSDRRGNATAANALYEEIKS